MHQLFNLTALLKNQETKEIEGFPLCYSIFTSPVQLLFFPVRSSLGLPLSFTGSVKAVIHPTAKASFHYVTVQHLLSVRPF